MLLQCAPTAQTPQLLGQPTVQLAAGASRRPGHSSLTLLRLAGAAGAPRLRGRPSLVLVPLASAAGQPRQARLLGFFCDVAALDDNLSSRDALDDTRLTMGGDPRLSFCVLCDCQNAANRNPHAA